MCLPIPDLGEVKEITVTGWGLDNLHLGNCLTAGIEPNPFSLCKQDFSHKNKTYEVSCDSLRKRNNLIVEMYSWYRLA